MVAHDDHAPLIFARRDLGMSFRIAFAPKPEEQCRWAGPGLVATPLPSCGQGRFAPLERWPAASLDSGELRGSPGASYFLSEKWDFSGLETRDVSYSFVARTFSAGPGAAGS